MYFIQFYSCEICNDWRKKCNESIKFSRISKYTTYRLAITGAKDLANLRRVEVPKFKAV